MYIGAIAVTLAASLASMAHAAAHAPANPPWPTWCYTTWGKGAVPYHTDWSTKYTPCTSVVTSTKTKARTLPPSTSTVTHTVTTVTTATTSTETDTATNTITDTVTNTNTETDTTTTVSTSTTATSTVATSPGFLPVQSTLPGSSYSGSAGPDPVVKREPEPAAMVEARKPSGQALVGFNRNLHPHGVNCIQQTHSSCAKTTRTVTSVSEITPSPVIVGTTATETDTIYPSATITITTETTTTSTTSTSTTTTTTATNIVYATATVYAACAENNLADAVDGQVIGETLNNNMADKFVTVSGITSAYDCKSWGVIRLDERRLTDVRACVQAVWQACSSPTPPFGVTLQAACSRAASSQWRRLARVRAPTLTASSRIFWHRRRLATTTVERISQGWFRRLRAGSSMRRRSHGKTVGSVQLLSRELRCLLASFLRLRYMCLTAELSGCGAGWIECTACIRAYVRRPREARDLSGSSGVANIRCWSGTGRPAHRGPPHPPRPHV
ncbi:hypothetical protein BDY17DRAFT_353822 [Neohortaea acidophila]|uniref:Uncharacterized protein n=1 Tax=Neohortaea acidophila TaxID=245834 RepID=A0A6A6PWS5_9PEZI|nr:uncharacterized protein BDY17DRAFT_353822 [Neohortaea acidophila]KAF2483727.1 hypothetical protein BDY17DRAFT_353822 [Neohortaea acidophila]